ncbi:hypothetical protein QBC41DRAFT_397861 [Cercophora samala]|uniref:NACHT domain-containing protein n=1 Tax=Cercophora samala TaxID=330535 RepID=A0AA40D889_9PEZI|nr:hypothetical protein QBC41DRAFT_397861 [Cercophora samala]
MTLHLCATSSEALQQMQADLRQWEAFNCLRHNELQGTLQPLAELVRGLQGPPKTELQDLNQLCIDLRALSLDTRRYVLEASVLKSLHYPELSLRHNIIPEAHKVTLNWAFGPLQGSNTDAFGGICRWLSGSGGLFWVSGKPGSGKSTLMKFIADNINTRKLLTHWSKGQEVILAAHYFTIYGNPIQRSLEGLLRSLVYNILRQEPTLIQRVLPLRYKNQEDQEPWKQSELQSVLKQLAGEHVHAKLCFFIDGLDEYAGDHLEICETLQELSQSPFVKLFVSSRPWNVFENALGGNPDSKLYMQSLTQTDIQQYAGAMLRSHPRWDNLVGEAGNEKADSLIQKIIQKSSGVFLWVTLVTRLLREGLTNDDSIRDLERRLDGFPSELGPFFQVILDSVDPFYLDRMARALLFALHAQKPLHIQMYMYLDKEYYEEDYALGAPRRIIATAQDAEWQLTAQAAFVFRRVNGWCKGLLERNHDQVEFLHRTVYDFLNTPELQQTLREKAKTNNADFCPPLSLLRAAIAYTKQSHWLEPPAFTSRVKAPEAEDPLVALSPFGRMVEGIVDFAQRLEELGGEAVLSATSLLDNMDMSIDTVASEVRESKTITIARVLYRYHILRAGLRGYLATKLPSATYLDRLSFARFICQSPLSVIFEEIPASKEAFEWVAKAIMDSGYSPNDSLLPREGGREMACDILSPNRTTDRYRRLFSLRQGTPWEQLVEMTTSMVLRDGSTQPHPNALSDFTTGLEYDAFVLLLGYGADVNSRVLIQSEGETFSIPIWLKFLLYAVHLPLFSKHTTAYEKTLDLMLKVAEPEHWLQSLRDSDHEHSLPALTNDLTSGRTMLETFGKSLSRLTWIEKRKFAGAGDWFVKMLPEAVRSEALSVLQSLGLDDTGVREIRSSHGNIVGRGTKRSLLVAGFVGDGSGDWNRVKRPQSQLPDKYSTTLPTGTHNNNNDNNNKNNDIDLLIRPHTTPPGPTKWWTRPGLSRSPPPPLKQRQVTIMGVNKESPAAPKPLLPLFSHHRSHEYHRSVELPTPKSDLQTTRVRGTSPEAE